MAEAMMFNGRQGIVIDDIVRWWKQDKRVGTECVPCIFFVDVRGDSFHVTYEKNQKGRSRRDSEFDALTRMA